jgi:hypothetical protein
MMWVNPPKRDKSAITPESPLSRFAITGMLAILLFLAICAFIYTGVFSRYLADDYCFSSQISQYHFWGAQWHSYVSWSNRFSTTFFISLQDQLGVIGMAITPGILISGLLGSAYLFVDRLNKRIGWRISKIVLFCLVGIWTYFCIYTAPSQFQSFYWQSGSVTYTLPLVFPGFLGSLLLNYFEKDLKGYKVLLIGLLFVIAGGFSETTVAMQIGMLVLGILLVFWKKKEIADNKKILIYLASALIGSLAAFVILFVAPGNAVRSANLPAAPSFFPLAWMSIRHALGFALQSFTSYPLPAAAVMISCFCLALQRDWKGAQPGRWGWIFWAIPLAVFLILVCCCAPSAYGESAYPEDRALIGARWVFLTGLLLWSYLLGGVFQHHQQANPKFQQKRLTSMSSFILIIFCLYLTVGLSRTLAAIPQNKERAAAWDARTTEIAKLKNSGQLDIQVNALDSMGRIREITDDPANWVNRCAAVYYGVQSITAK